MEIEIYQINPSRDIYHVSFLGYGTTLDRQGMVDSRIYDKIFQGEVACNNLEEVFYIFNKEGKSPAEYCGRSLSVSDVVAVIHDDGSRTYHFCDRIGFVEIPFNADSVPIKKDTTIKVVLCEPSRKARIQRIRKNLSGFQATVDGSIEVIYPFEDKSVCLVYNGAGKNNRLPFNRAVRFNEKGQQITDIIAGTFFICGYDTDGFTSLSEEQLATYQKQFLLPELFIRVNGNIRAIRDYSRI